MLLQTIDWTIIEITELSANLSDLASVGKKQGGRTELQIVDSIEQLIINCQ